MYRNLLTFFIAVFVSTGMDAWGQSFWARTYDAGGADSAQSIQTTSDGGFVVAGVAFATSNDFWVLKLDSSGNIQWQKTYGGNGADSALSIQTTSEGGFIVAGGSSSFGAGSSDVWILKLDSSGNIEWQKTYGGAGIDFANSIQTTSDGGFVTAGYTTSFGAGSADIWILKLDGNGNIQWQKTYGGSANDIATSIQLISDGGFIVAGYAQSFGAGSYDIWILKLDSSGNVQWQKTYGGDGTDFGLSIQTTSDDGFIVGGSTSSFGAGLNDFWILKLDSTGNIQWQKTYGGAGEDHAQSIETASDGGYLVAGNFFAPTSALWALKLDSSGNIQWQKLYGGGSTDNATATSVQQTSNGRILVAGHTSSSGFGSEDVWILRLNSNGEIDSSCAIDSVAVPADTGVVPGDAAYSINEPPVTVSNSTAGVINTTATIAEQCASPNGPPVAVDDSYMTPSNTPLNVAAPGVLGNDFDDDLDPLTAVSLTGPASGMLTLNGDGSFNYTPNAGFVGADTFTYVADDGTVNSNIATVTITVTEGCLFCDDFEDGVLDPSWTYEKPEWVESGGFLRGTPTKKKAIAVASPAFAGCTTCEFEASVRTAGGGFNKIWMYIHRVDKRTLTELLIKEENNKVILKQRINKTIVAKNKATVTINPNTEYTFRISFDGAQYSVFMNDAFLFSMNPGGSVPNATVGVAAMSTTISVGHINIE